MDKTGLIHSLRVGNLNVEAYESTEAMGKAIVEELDKAA